MSVMEPKYRTISLLALAAGDPLHNFVNLPQQDSALQMILMVSWLDLHALIVKQRICFFGSPFFGASGFEMVAHDVGGDSFQESENRVGVV